MTDDPLVRVVLNDGRSGLYDREDSYFFADCELVPETDVLESAPADLSDGLSEGVSVLVLSDEGHVITAYDLFEAMSERFGVDLVERALKAACREAGIPWSDE